MALEQVQALGMHGSMAWVLTNKRLVLRHVSTIPAQIPSPARVQELKSNGWRKLEIANMYGCSESVLRGYDA